MKDADDSNIRRWEDLPIDILVKIFQSLDDVVQLTFGIPHVCSAWRMACYDPLLCWKTLDLSMLISNFIKIPKPEPFVYVDGRSDRTLTRLLKISLSLSRQSIMTLIFHFNLYVTDEQLAYTAERSPQLRRLVLPAWNRITETGMYKAIRGWKELESLTVSFTLDPLHLLQAISTHCKNFSELKIMGPFDILFASSLAEVLPKLRVLSLRCSLLYKDVLIFILDNLKHLQVLNISHCVLVEEDLYPLPLTLRIIKEIDQSIRQKASRLREFITCMDDSCIMCQRTRTDEGLVRWYKYEEGLWKADEVRSLAL